MANHREDDQDVAQNAKNDEDRQHHSQNNGLHDIQLWDENLAAVATVFGERLWGHVVFEGNHLFKMSRHLIKVWFWGVSSICTLILDSLKENVETTTLAVEQEHWGISSIAMREHDEI